MIYEIYYQRERIGYAKTEEQACALALNHRRTRIVPNGKPIEWLRLSARHLKGGGYEILYRREI